jgi:hypothetical protein
MGAMLFFRDLTRDRAHGALTQEQDDDDTARANEPRHPSRQR